jgi:hypothetical protein
MTGVGARRGRKSWAEKLRPDMQPSLVADRNGFGLMLIATPMLVARQIAAIPQGETISMAELRARLANAHHAQSACPMTTAIFYNIVAGASEDDRAAGRRVLAPWWRVTLPDLTLSPKTPPGPQVQAERLQAEGHRVMRDARGRWLLLS